MVTKKFCKTYLKSHAEFFMFIKTYSNFYNVFPKGLNDSFRVY